MTVGRARRDVVEVVTGFSPRSVPEEAALLARGVVGRIGAPNPARAKAFLFACSRLIAFGLSVGLDPDPEVLFHEAVIERFVLVGTGSMSPASVRTLRTNLRHVARRIEAHPHPRPVLLSREAAKAPYSAAEIAAYLANADAQPTTARALRCAGLVCAGAGAGLMGQELRSLRGIDVLERSGGLLVEVQGRRPRVVPVLPVYHERLVTAAAHAGEGYLIGGLDPERLNVTCRLVASLSGGSHLDRLDVGRLRATWLRDCAERIGLSAFMAAAGLRCSQRLGDIVAGIDPPDEAEAVALLGRPR